MDSLAKKMTAHDVCFSVWAVKDLFSEPMEREKGRKLHSNVKWCYSSHLSPVQLLNLRLKAINSACTPVCQPAEAVDDEIIPAQFRPSLGIRNTFLFRLLVKTVYSYSHCNKYINKLGLSWDILNPSWEWTEIKIYCIELINNIKWSVYIAQSNLAESGRLYYCETWSSEV